MTKGLLSRFIAAVVLAFGFGYLGYQINLAKLKRLQTWSAQANLDYERHLADHGYMHAVLLVAILGLLYMLLVEVVAYLLRRCSRIPGAV